MSTMRIDGLECTRCGYEFEVASEVVATDGGPDDGAVCICAECGQVDLFVETPDGLGLRTPTNDERQELMRDPDIRAASYATKAYRMKLTRG